MTTKLEPKVMQDVLTALTVSAIPDVWWINGDNLCDCTFQRVGDWTNPYIARTLRVRLCCIWAELYKQFPQFVQEIPAYFDANTNTYETVPYRWDSEEMDMPVALWHRQLAAQTGKDLGTIRTEYAGRERERPKKVRRGKGRESRPTPAPEILAAARQAELRAATWIID